MTKHLIRLSKDKPITTLADLVTECGLTAVGYPEGVVTFDAQDADCVKCLRKTVLDLQFHPERRG